MNPPTPPPPAASGGQDPPPSPLKLRKESVRPGPKSLKTDVIPPPSHTATTRWKYHVFLSFRGDGTRKNFTKHLHRALLQRGISTYLDDEELRRGDDISPGLLKAIEESQIAIVILSTNYANSTWCLDELAKIVECRKVLGQKVFPVFYDVFPNEVRKQTGYVGEAFSQHHQRFKDDMKKIQKWRSALTEVASLAGWDLRHGHEAKGIHDIVEGVCIEINSTVSREAECLVGMDSRVEQVLSHLDMSGIGVRVIGICGAGGIGKTTIAKAVFERIRYQFDACSFLANVREVSKRRAGLVDLQQKLLSDTTPLSNANIHEIEMGIDIIKRRLRTTRVLIILDDVDQLEQLEALCGHDSFGPGSRIIITSRNRGLLSAACGEDKIYEVGALTEAEALQLFRPKYFDKGQVEENISELSKKVVEFSRGLPLAIVVLGSFLKKTGAEAWKRLEGKTITDVLKASFDGLSGVDKKVFLDIACFFNGEDRDRVTRILESCGLDADTSVKDLMVRSLVTLSGRKLAMHDLIQKMGWNIVRQESQEPGKRSRLWLPRDIIPVLTNNKGTSTIEGIFLNLPEQEEVELTVDPFLKMRNLKYLKVRNVNFSGYLEYLCDELRLLDWHSCPLKYLPSDFQPDKLVELIMQSSRIKQLWSGVKSCNMLKLIDLSDCQYLIKTPDLTGVPNIETLVLEGCTSLIEVHRSIGVLKKLVLLNMRNCSSVQSLPPLIGLESLEVLILSGCSGLNQFPRIEGNMKRLLELHLDRTAIVELPEEIKCLTSLSVLSLQHCENLLLLPDAIRDLLSLQQLYLTGSLKLCSIPEDLSSVECLEELDISGTAGKDLNSLPSLGRKFPPLLSWHQHIRDFSGWFFQNLRNWNMMEGKTPNGGYLYSSTDLISSNYNNSVSFGEIIIIIICEIIKCLFQIYCTSEMDYQYQFKGSTSGVSATTSCKSLIDSLPLTHEGIVDLDKEAFSCSSQISFSGKEADWASSERYLPIKLAWPLIGRPHCHVVAVPYVRLPPIKQVDRAQEAKQEETSKSQRGKELMEFVPLELFCPSSKKKEPHSPIEQVQKAKEEDEMEKSNAEKEDGNKEDKSYLFLYCSLFPSDYEFRKHELVQLWIAEGFNMEERHGETMEDAGLRHFDSLESKGFFKQSRCDFEVDFDSAFSVPMYSPSSFFYKVNPVELSLLENSSSSADSAEYFRAVDSKLDGASESTTKHLSLIYEEDIIHINEMIFGVLPKFKNLRTLLLLSGHGSSIKRVPGELFMSLNILPTLNLSRTLISGLPSSIENVQQLRYLDVSYTLITRLPESIGSLNKLQTLKLRGCKDLFDLPRSMHRLTALRHLDFDIIRQLDFMPAQLGKLSNLQSLSAFLVGRDDGRRIQELKNLNDLGGALRIFRLENVLSKADAEEVDLENKKRLQRLDFRWTKLMGENENKMQEEILDSLRPPKGLKELQILFYNGKKFPSWLSNTSITDLVVITLYKCAYCESLPSLGQLPKLKFLSIVEMNKVTEIDQTFFGRIDHQKNAFPALEILEVDSMLNLKDWKEIQQGDFESLIKLTMETCPELVTVPSFSRLKSLKYLEFNHCPELLSLDRNALPTSLKSLIIRDCPKLKEWCHEEGHQDLSFLESCS